MFRATLRILLPIAEMDWAIHMSTSNDVAIDWPDDSLTTCSRSTLMKALTP